MSRLSSRIAQAFAVSLAVVAVVAACGSEGGSNFDPIGTSGASNGSTGVTSGSTGQTSGVFNSNGSTGSDEGGTSGTSGTSNGNIDPSCVALTCAAQGLGCGLAGDGCGRQIDCGGCAANQRCGGDGKPSQCVELTALPNNVCTPKDCAAQGIKCGQAGDGCGNTLNCGGCAADEQCGGLGHPSECVKLVATQADGGACVPKTAAAFDIGAPGKADDDTNCGVQSDGCGGTIDLGDCTGATEFCGGAGPSKCGVSGGGTTCTKRTCAFYPSTVCGPQSDGCGGVILTAGGTPANCGAGCVAPQVCGGGGVAGVCGGGTLVDDAGNACVPKAACSGLECGMVADGCGGVFNCGTTACTGTNICGGGGTPNVCGQPACTQTARNVACNGRNCGIVGNGCGGTWNCAPANVTDGGTGCTPPQVCGGGGVPNACGGGAPTADGGIGGGPCVPMTATSPGSCTTNPQRQCGPFADGCGGTYTCGTGPTFCPAGESCGGAGVDSVCGSPQCTPIPQATACTGKTCGFVPDGCGNSYQCGVGSGLCPYAGRIGDSCGGGGTANVCGGGVPCTGTYCGTQPQDCSGPNTPNTTTISGRVFAPNQSLPIHDALVYIPNGTLDAVPTGITSCDTCAPPSGNPFVQANTDTSGNFTLANVPVPVDGAGVPQPVVVVIQKGRWRKVQTITPNRCNLAANGGPKNLTIAEGSFNSTQSGSAAAPAWVPSNNIPKFAVTTGGADAMQCLFRRIGISMTEFTNPAGTGRVNVYGGAGGTGRYNVSFNGGANFPGETTLYGDVSTTVANDANLLAYDGVILTCTGASDAAGGPYAGYYDDMKSYADKGGKVFASHWHHSWLHRAPTPWDTSATFNDTANQGDGAITATIDQSTTYGANLATWLRNSPSPSALGSMSVSGSRRTLSAIGPLGRSLITAPALGNGCNGDGTCPAGVQYSDFLTPMEAAAPTKCGRFVMSDLHVSGASGDSVNNGTNVCTGGTRAGLSCNNGGACPGVGGGTCNGTGSGFPTNCADGSSGTLNGLSDQEKILAYMLFDLTTCIDNTPPPTTCTPRTCASYPQNGGPNNGQICGQYSDGCSDIIKNGSGQPQSCGTCPSGQSCVNGYCSNITCVPNTCAAGQCGSIPDGCGGTLTCTCPVGAGTCGGGGQANVCGTAQCTPLTCATGAPAGFCGSTGNGCGGSLTCTCPAGQLCGGAGQPNRCGVCTPIPQATACAGKNCGDVPNGCGGSWNCGSCATGQNCGGGGQANTCGAGSCVAQNCAAQGAQCGTVSDGCSGTTTCPDCAGTDFCNAQNLCVGTSCTAKTCVQLGVECGPTSDTCGGIAKDGNGNPGCGTCPAGQACGANGQAGKCGIPACNPSTCTQLGAVCGQVANGCGGLTANCGSCPGTNSCVNGACVVACTPRTCAEAGAECGFVGDGCGGAIDCGQCAAGDLCGYNNQANKCGNDIVK